MTTTTDKPIILLAHGAWHVPSLYDPLKHALSVRGYELLVPQLATMGTEKTGVSWDADVSMLVETAKPLFEQGKDVFLLGHSYGGIPSCIATQGNGVEDRRTAGKSGGFSQIAFLCAFAMPAKGESVLTISGGNWLPWHRVIEHSTGGKQLFVNEKAKDLLYNDFSPDQAEATFKSLVPCSYEAFSTGVTFAVPDVTIPKTFIVCEGDALFPPDYQRAVASACGPDLQQVSVSGGHSSFASVPEELADVLVTLHKAGRGQ
ncbi:alpha/beta-hydrolase [Xylariaceae sp. FL0804]|nr:alpha/beta-hydrolase [Xylariaceae sp. FL0804]